MPNREEDELISMIYSKFRSQKSKFAIFIDQKFKLKSSTNSQIVISKGNYDDHPNWVSSISNLMKSCENRPLSHFQTAAADFITT